MHLHTTADGSNAATDWWSEWEDVSNKPADGTDLGPVAGPEMCDNLRLVELPLAATSNSSLP